MCLYIEHRVDINILKCFKILGGSIKTGFYTPYRGTRVNNNGWLVPTKMSKRQYFDQGSKINGGFIHAFKKMKVTDGRRKAYAIQVVAFGNPSSYHLNNDKHLVCRAMYIPDADTTKSKKETMEFLDGNPSIEQIIEKFPFLANKLTVKKRI